MPVSPSDLNKVDLDFVQDTIDMLDAALLASPPSDRGRYSVRVSISRSMPASERLYITNAYKKAQWSYVDLQEDTPVGDDMCKTRIREIRLTVEA